MIGSSNFQKDNIVGANFYIVRMLGPLLARREQENSSRTEITTYLAAFEVHTRCQGTHKTHEDGGMQKVERRERTKGREENEGSKLRREGKMSGTRLKMQEIQGREKRMMREV